MARLWTTGFLPPDFPALRPGDGHHGGVVHLGVVGEVEVEANAGTRVNLEHRSGLGAKPHVRPFNLPGVGVVRGLVEHRGSRGLLQFQCAPRCYLTGCGAAYRGLACYRRVEHASS